MTGAFGDVPFGEQPKHRIYPLQPGELTPTSSHPARKLSRTPRAVCLFAKCPLPSAHVLRVPPTPLRRARGLLERFGCFPCAGSLENAGLASTELALMLALPKAFPGHAGVGPCAEASPRRVAISSSCGGRCRLPWCRVVCASLHLPVRWRCSVFLPGRFGCVR